MAQKAIIIFLLSIFLRNISWAQEVYKDTLPNFHSNIADIVKVAIENRAFPGCVVMAIHSDSILFQGAYGYHTYDSLQETQLSDIFDLASITKVMAATLAMMKLYEDGYYKLDDPLGDHLDHLGHKGLKKVTFRQVLAHQAGLPGWIRYYQSIVKKDAYKRNIISGTMTNTGYQISDSLFLVKQYYPKIRKAITTSKLNKNPAFQYSDLFFYLVPELVENWTGLSLPEYLDIYFYKPLYTSTLAFNPMDKFPLERIIPTEIDTFFRNTHIHGKVHDEGAILMRGVSGHAGLFGNAEDLALVWLMLMHGGTLNGVSVLKPSTIDLFTAYQFPNQDNRRGLGFDKPLLTYDSLKSSVAKSASFQSYGHTGFTGTLVWADPEYDFLYIFLSNRVYPTRDSKGIYELNVRPSIHEILYEEIKRKLSGPCK